MCVSLCMCVCVLFIAFIVLSSLPKEMFTVIFSEKDGQDTKGRERRREEK